MDVTAVAENQRPAVSIAVESCFHLIYDQHISEIYVKGSKLASLFTFSVAAQRICRDIFFVSFSFFRSPLDGCWISPTLIFLGWPSLSCVVHTHIYIYLYIHVIAWEFLSLFLIFGLLRHPICFSILIRTSFLLRPYCHVDDVVIEAFFLSLSREWKLYARICYEFRAIEIVGRAVSCWPYIVSCTLSNSLYSALNVCLFVPIQATVFSDATCFNSSPSSWIYFQMKCDIPQNSIWYCFIGIVFLSCNYLPIYCPPTLLMLPPPLLP